MKMTNKKFKEVVVREPVILPALSTDAPERTYTFIQFLNEWLLSSKGMRKDENHEYVFEWEDTLESFMASMSKKAGVTSPALPVRGSLPEVVAKHREDVLAFVEAISKACVGEVFYISEDAFKAGKQAAKEALDAADVPNPMGATSLPKPWALKVLRHYHALGQSKSVEEKDVPRTDTAAVEASN
jgi:hypothetical protein